jgi:phosphatidylinositol alpha-mannosyltransferase
LSGPYSAEKAKRAMRICLVTPYDLTHDGGVNSHIRSLAPMLREAGHHVAILGPASGAVPFGCDGLPGTVAVPANGSVARIGLFAPPSAVARYLERGRFDLVHVHEPYVPGIASLAVRYAKVPIVATFHAYAEHEHFFSRVARRAMSRHLGRLRHAIAASASAADFAKVIYDGSIQVIPNGIDTTMFAPSRTPRTSPPDRQGSLDPLRLLFVGRYDEPRKGLVYLLDAVAKLRTEGRHVVVRVAGNGTREGIADLARRAGAQFLGRLDDTALAAAYRDCDVFCAPSIYGESFGIVLLEAMACGRPVVASDIRGYRDAVAGAALLVPPADADALARALKRVIDDTTLRDHLVDHGFRRAAELDWRHMVQRVASVYRSALAPSYPLLSANRPVELELPA